MFIRTSLWGTKQKGSVLVFCLIILAFLLITALSAATVVLSDRKTAASTDKSNVSFQVADSAAEYMLYRVYKGGFDSSPLGELASPPGSCNNGVISGNIGAGSYRIVFFNNDNDQLTDCSDGSWRTGANSVVKLKAEGSYNNTTRVVEAGIAPPP